MTLHADRARECLKAFDFTKLFIEELGWDCHSAVLDVPVDGQTFTLTAVAHKRGMAAFVCPAPPGSRIPDYPTRRKIERQVTKSVHEHLIIYTDSDRTTQVWQWVKRELGRPTACREHTYHRKQPGDALIQKLRNLAVALHEEERLTLVGVTTRVRAAFDVERVTRRFYDRFKSEHAAFLRFVKGIPDEEMERWYVSVMLNRLMFIYFIQKKGFLDGDTDYLRHKLAQSQQRGRDRFYADLLCPLFFEGFAKRPQNRSAETNRLLGKVPYLNGGIFMPHQIEQLHGRTIEIPDKAFEQLFAFFDAYQWHLDERPLRQDNEINPDVLGYIFEKYINQKQMGAYYTKEDITGYISQNTVIPFLFDAAREKCKVAFETGAGAAPAAGCVWRLLHEDPDRYIYPAVRHGVIRDDGSVVPETELPDFVQTGMHDPKARMHDKRYNLQQAPADDPIRLVTETWREYVYRRTRCLELREKLKCGTGVPPVLTVDGTFAPFHPSDDLSIARRNLPHWQQPGRTYFVTFRLADALPAAQLAQWRDERKQWLASNPEPWSESARAEYARRFPERLQAWLDAGNGACPLRDPEVSSIVENALRHFDGERYLLDAYAIMPNHVHLLVMPLEGHDLSSILHTWKSFTAHEIQRVRHTKGTVWQDESFDHIVRSVRHLEFFREYIRHNPSNANLPNGTFRCGQGKGVEVSDKSTGETPVPHFSINDLITYNLDIRQFAQDVIENCEGPELLVAFWKAIESVSVLDPACGSGAFLFAALNILEPLYEACLERMQFFLDEWGDDGKKNHPNYYKLFKGILERVEAHPNRRYFILKSIVINNLYGVDIMEEAVEICKLRLFLKLVAQIDRVEDIEPLPDIDFNIRAGNSLVGFVSLDEVKKVQAGRLGFAASEIAQIEEEAELADRAFQQFRRQQTEFGGTVTAEDKKALAGRLARVATRLDRYLAAEYLIDTERIREKSQLERAFNKWRASHKPIHWLTEFFGIMHSGGFSVIIGNPPYVEYGKVKTEYTIHGYDTLDCGNLYAYFAERSLDILAEGGRLGKIVQLPIVCTDRMKPLQHECLGRGSRLWFANFDDRPGRLFDGLQHIRATIFTVQKGIPRQGVYTTTYNRWQSQARGNLFQLVHFAETSAYLADGAIPKIGSEAAKALRARIANLRRLGTNLGVTRGHKAYFHNSPQYWIRAMDFAPYFWNERDGEQVSTHVRTLNAPTRAEASAMVALLNSSLFYWWFILLSNCRDLVAREIESFPVGLDRMTKSVSARLEELVRELMADFKRHKQRKECEYRATGKVVYDEFYPGRSKPIIDQIDAVLAEHYGFTDEELDFIINYDIKYRMGPEAGEEEGDE